MSETRTHHSAKLGDVPYTDTDILHFPQGLPGFESLRNFLLVSRDECAPIVFLAPLEDGQVALPLLPWQLAAGPLSGMLPASALRSASDNPEALLAHYAVVMIGPEGKKIYANLRAPVVVNLDARTGRQVILSDEALPLTAAVGA